MPDGEEDGELAALANEPKALGTEPGTGRTVSLRRGPYGPYVQIDPAPEEAVDYTEYDAAIKAWEIAKAAAKAEGKKAPKKPTKPKAPKPKRQGLPKGLAVTDVTLEAALSLLALPRDVGEHPETGKMIKAGIGRFGPFVQHDGKFASIPKDEDVMTIGMNRAVDLIAKKMERDTAKEAAKTAKGAGGVDEKKNEKAAVKKKAAKKKPAAKKKAAPKKKKSA